MQILTCELNEGLVIDGRTTVTVVDIRPSEVTFDVTDEDGRTERMILPVRRAGEFGVEKPELATC